MDLLDYSAQAVGHLVLQPGDNLEMSLISVLTCRWKLSKSPDIWVGDIFPKTVYAALEIQKGPLHDELSGGEMCNNLFFTLKVIFPEY